MNRRAPAAALRVLAGLLAALPVTAAEPTPGARRNALAGEASPYLQMHASNPVDWHPWGPAALERARREDKPIFLSVGYSTCYWCHVMEREVFSNPEIAALLNASFVSVKVDREERPDVDELYMQATRLLTGSGGWPNSLFLTPDGKPFFAGTYFPPADSDAGPGFPTLVEGIAKRWKEQRSEVVARAEQVAAALAAEFASTPAVDASFDPKDLLARSVDALSRQFDEEYGGFGRGAKFPSPPQLELLLEAHRRGVPGRAVEMLRRTLDEMAWGGIRDHLAGGFHRYATERSWSVPHFEKMLYDNAQLLGLYARAYRALGDPLYRQVAEELASYLADEMTHPLGGLLTAQDAEVAGEEGASYLWTGAEIREVLGPALAAEFLATYALAPVQRDRPEPGALRLRLPIATSLARTGAADTVALTAPLAGARARLLTARRLRQQPLRDDKVLAAWNGLAIRGLVDAGVELEHPEYVDRAARAAHFALARLRGDDGRLRRSYVAGQARERAVLDDYAFLADGLIALHSATGDARWLQPARQLADRMLADCEGPPGTGFYLQARADGAADDLFLRPRVLTDGVRPAGNAVAFRVLRDLAMLTGDARYAQAAERTRSALSSLFERAPAAVATAVRALASGPQLPAPPRPADVATPAPAPLERMPTGRDFVRSRLERTGDTRVVVRLEIAEGWHVNANPASLDFLVPTRVEAGSGGIEVGYPEGSRYHPRFSLEPLAVYEGSVSIPVTTRAKELSLTFQACDDSTCLPPETVELTAP